MFRQKVDPEKAQKAVESVRRGMMTYRQLAAAYGIEKNSICAHFKGNMGISSRVGARTVLMAGEENAIEGV